MSESNNNTPMRITQLEEATEYPDGSYIPIAKAGWGTKKILANTATPNEKIIQEELNAEFPNLWNCSYTSVEANGITFTRKSDGTFEVKGTATALFYRQQTITLPAGTYYINGIEGGSSQSYHILISGTGSTYYIIDGWSNPIVLTQETAITLTFRILSGVTVDTVLKPIIVNNSYYTSLFDYIPFNYPFYNGTVDEKIQTVVNLTGYKKPNLFNNQLKSREVNGITFTVNDDKSVSISGTSTALTFFSQQVTLPEGKYLINGCNDGGSVSFHIMVVKGSDVYYQFGGKDVEIELTEETTITLYLRITANQTVDTVMFPMIRKSDVYNNTYAPYNEYQVYKPIQQLIDYTSFNWSGKKMNVIGDSIVQGSYGNFIIPIRNILCLSEARNYGVGGSCLASSSQDEQYPPSVLRYTEMNLDAQIIIVHAGTNDYSAQIPLGDSTSTDITTFNGALNVMMNGLREMYPTALIIFDSILHRYNDNQLEIKASQYRQAIEDRCLANHIVFYDCYKYSGFDFVKGYYDHILTVDGLHPNQAGANILGRKLAGFIRWN